MGKVIGPDVLFEIFFRGEGRTGLEHDDAETACGEDFGGSASGRAGADDADVVELGRADDLHACRWKDGGNYNAEGAGEGRCAAS